jgi:hypothetical protein
MREYNMQINLLCRLRLQCYKFMINGPQRLCFPLLRRGKVVLRKIKEMLSVWVFRPKPVAYPVLEGKSCGPFTQMSL